MQTIHLDLLNHISDLDLTTPERSLILELIIYYNDNRNKNMIIDFVSSQNSLVKKLRIDSRTLKKVLSSLGHNTKDVDDLEKDIDPKIIFNYTITNKSLRITLKNKFLSK